MDQILKIFAQMLSFKGQQHEPNARLFIAYTWQGFNINSERLSYDNISLSPVRHHYESQKYDIRDGDGL
jgi:hypothetical protein